MMSGRLPVLSAAMAGSNSTGPHGCPVFAKVRRKASS
jgi:hypothetical protein